MTLNANCQPQVSPVRITQEFTPAEPENGTVRLQFSSNKHLGGSPRFSQLRRAGSVNRLIDRHYRNNRPTDVPGLGREVLMSMADRLHVMGPKGFEQGELSTMRSLSVPGTLSAWHFLR